jgi:hypothetical protein
MSPETLVGAPGHDRDAGVLLQLQPSCGVDVRQNHGMTVAPMMRVRASMA